MIKNQKTDAKIGHFALMLLTLNLLTACFGCHTVQSSYDPGVASGPTLPCPVALRLTKEFTSYQHVTPQVAFVNDGYTANFGPPLQKYATFVAQSVFGEVQILDDQPPRNGVKLVLVPKVSGTDLKPPFGGVSVSSGTLGVHWDFNDPQTGKTLFSTRIQAESSHPTSLTDSHMADVVDGLLTNLTSATLQRFNSSKDLKQLTGH